MRDLSTSKPCLSSAGFCCSISAVYRAVCSLTGTPGIIKAYERAKMKPKNFARMEREVRLMRALGGGEGLVQLYTTLEDAAFKYLVRPAAAQTPVQRCHATGCCSTDARAWASRDGVSAGLHHGTGGTCQVAAVLSFVRRHDHHVQIRQHQSLSCGGFFDSPAPN